MRSFIFIILFLTVCFGLFSQNQISGFFPAHADQELSLHAFKGFKSYKIDRVKIDSDGNFTLTYSEVDYGMGYLSFEGARPFFVILAEETLRLKGDKLSVVETVETEQGLENQLFATYASEHPRRIQVVRALDFLDKIYEADPLFSDELASREFITAEILKLQQQDQRFLDEIPTDLYVSWYLPVRKLVSSVSFIAQYSAGDIPATIAAFRTLDHTDSRLYRSGLLKDVMDSHYWLIENSGKTLDSVFIEMNRSIDHLIEQLLSDEDKFNEITAYLFELLERRSLFNSAEYLALKILNETTCTLDGNLANQLESYRAMKVGNVAADIKFKGDILKNGLPTSEKGPHRMSQLESDFLVVAFGSAWCPACREEIPQLVPLYSKWKESGVEVIYVSLDRERQAFSEFVKNFPFISFSDYQVWEMEAVKDYFVFGTPTYFLLNSKTREIILRPRSVRQIDSWVDWFLLREE